MKRLFLLLLVCVMAFTLAACGQKPEPEPENELPQVGWMNLMGLDNEEVLKSRVGHLKDAHGVSSPETVPHTYDGLTQMLLALDADEISVIAGMPQSVSEYVANCNDELVAVPADDGLTDHFAMMVMEDNQEVYNLLNDAIAFLKMDGTVDKLIYEYITKILDGKEPYAIELPTFENARTIRVAITGDMPPMDYVSVDGTPAGFNTALLSAIAYYAHVNIEIHVVDCQARAAALTSGKVDAIFWIKYERCSLDKCGEMALAETAENTVITEDYFTDSRAYIMKQQQETPAS